MAARPNVTEILESLIDQTSLLDVLTGLECICAEKAEHIRANWQDRANAKPWANASRAFGTLARKPDISLL